MRDRAWEQLDADVREDEAAMGGEIRGLTQRQHEERIRWMNRLSCSSNSGAAYLRATRSESGQSIRGDTPPAAMSDPEEDRAWSMFDAAKSSVERGKSLTLPLSHRMGEGICSVVRGVGRIGAERVGGVAPPAL